MPELPEVETMRRGIASIVGQRINDVFCPPCTRRPIAMSPSIATLKRRMVGRTVVDVGRRGKRVMIRIEDDQTLVIEPRMTGIVMLADPPTLEHLRLQIELDGRVARMLFWDRRGLGTIRLLRAAEIASKIDDRLGPDALSITAEALRQRLGQSRRCVKVALLDQSAVAGIGNMYAAEILFLAGVDPRTRCHRLSGPQWVRIATMTHRVLDDAIRHEGSTLSDGTYRNALNQDGSFQNYHQVYDREGRVCGRCGEGAIRRIVQAQRSTFFCPVCQRRRGLHHSVHCG